MTVTLRPVSPGDKDQILRWRNAPHVAEYMYTNHEISQREHDHWLALIEAKLSRHWLMPEKLA